MTGEGFRMTSFANVILEPFGPERTSRAGSAKGKNLNSCLALVRKSQTDPLPGCERGVLGGGGRSREEREEGMARVEDLGCSHQRAVCSITQSNGTR
jgi:hypothetical protein